MPTTELEIKQLAGNGGSDAIAPITVPDAVIFEDGDTLTEKIDEINAGFMPFPDYSQETNIISSFPANPVSSTTAGYTFPTDALVFFSADKSSQGFTLYANVDGHSVATIPAHVAFGGVALTFPVRKGSKLVFKTDSTSTTWTLRVVKYFPLVMS